jgi:hypothetical protein
LKGKVQDRHAVPDGKPLLKQLRICGGRRLRPALALDPVHLGTGAATQERLLRHPVVALGVVGPNRALVTEPDLDSRPVVHLGGEQLVRAPRRLASRERDVRGSARRPRRLDRRAQPIGRGPRRLLRGLGDEDGRHSPPSSIAAAAVTAGA